MKIQIGWRMGLVIGLVMLVGLLAITNDAVAIALMESLAGILTAISGFGS